MKKKIKIWDFFWKSLPHTHIKYRVIDFAPSNKSTTANKLPSTNLEQFVRQIKAPLTR